MGCVTSCFETSDFGLRKLSIPYHGSWAVSRRLVRRPNSIVLTFQYPTTGRGLCHAGKGRAEQCRGMLSIPYHGSWAVSRRHKPRRLARVELLSIPYHGSWAVSRTGGHFMCLFGRTFQYPTTGRGLCHSYRTAMQSVIRYANFQYPTTGRGLCHIR